MQLIKEIGGGKHYWDVAREKHFCNFSRRLFERKNIWARKQIFGQLCPNDEDGQLGNSKVKMDCWRIGPLQKKFEFVFFVFS